MVVRTIIRSSIALVGAIFAALLLVVSCDEKDVTIISDHEEIQRYINESLEGRELFRINGLINEDTFAVPNDPAVYVDLVDSTKRGFVFVSPPATEVKRYISPQLTVRDAELLVSDELYVRRLRILGDDTTEMADTRTVRRYAHFLKLGSDLQSFAGWKLFGFNGRGPQFPLAMMVEAPGNIVIPVDSAQFDRFQYHRIDPITGEFSDTVSVTRIGYVRVDQIPNIDGGVDIETSCVSVPGRSVYTLVSGRAFTGPVTDQLNRPTADTYSHSLPSQFSPPYLWNLLFFQEYRVDFSGGDPILNTWCVPYRVP